MADQDARAGGNGAARVAASPAELERTTEEIARMIRELRAAQKSVRTTMMLGSLAIVVVMLGYGWFTYVTVSDNLAGAKLQQAAMEQAKLLAPQLEAKVKDTLHDVLPFYMQMGKDRLSKIRPKLEASLMAQRDKLPNELREGISKQIDERFTKISKDATAQLAANFPAIGVDSGRHATEQLKAELVNKGQALREHVVELATAEMDKARSTMQKFPLRDTSNTTTDTLVRGLLHNLITLADYEVLATSTPPSVQRANLTQEIPLAN